MHVKIPWEISNIFGEHVKEDSDDEEEEVEAYEDSKKLLKVRLFLCLEHYLRSN